MKWQKGKQGSLYYKFPLITLPKFDMYLLKIPQGSFVPTHTDPVEGKKALQA